MENRYRRLLNNSLWSMIGNTGSKVLGFLLLPLYTRWLGTAGFGESDLIITYSSLLVCIMTMCVADGIFVFTKNQDEKTKVSYYSSTLIFIAIVLIVWMILWLLLEVAFSYFCIHNSFTDNLWPIFGIVVSTFFQQYSQQFILSLDKIKIYSFTGLLFSLITLIFSYLLIPRYGVTGYIWAMIYANFFTTLYSFFFSHSYQYFRFKAFDRGKIIKLINYSALLIPNGIMWWLVSALNRPVMEYNLNYSDIGIFAIANRFPAVITMLFSVLSFAWNISVFEEYGKEGYEDFYKKTFRMMFLTITFLSSLVIMFSEIIIKIFAAPAFFEAWKYMIILIIGAFLSCMSGFFGTNFGVVKQSKYYMYSSVWGALASILFSLLLIPILGIMGASISVLFSFAVTALSRYKYSRKFVSISLFAPIMRYIMVLFLVSAITFYITTLWIRGVFVVLVLFVLILREHDILVPIYLKIKQ